MTDTIPYFPNDDKEYIVKSYGLIRKNPSPAASPYLVEVYIEQLDNRKEQIIEVLLTHLYVVRINSVWKKQRIIYEYHDSEKRGFVRQKIAFSFNNAVSPTIQLLVKNKTTGKKKMVLLDKRDPKEDEILSVFTVLAVVDGTKVFIPSLEILLSTYVPHTHTILHDLITSSLNNVVLRHVVDCTIKDKLKYDIKLKSEYSRSTKFFLAYLSCNQATRKNVSKIRSSLTSNRVFRRNVPYSYIEVFPYHPSEFNIRALGLYDEEKRRFWVHQINDYELPSEYYIPDYEYEKTNKSKKNNTQKRLNNENEIIKDLDLINDIDAGRNAGKKYIKSGVAAIVPWKKVYKVKKTEKESKTLIGNVAPSEPKAASATPLSGQNASKPIAAVEYKNKDDKKNKKENHLNILIDALKSLNGEIYFLNDKVERNIMVSFCKLKKRKTFDGRRSSWALISKDRPRKLLVCEICLQDGFVYMLDIERKNKDTYAGIMFYSIEKIDLDLLKKIKDVASVNQGRFGGDKKRRKFPVDNYKSFRHYSEKTKMENSIRSLIDKIKPIL